MPAWYPSALPSTCRSISLQAAHPALDQSWQQRLHGLGLEHSAGCLPQSLPRMCADTASPGVVAQHSTCCRLAGHDWPQRGAEPRRTGRRSPGPHRILAGSTGGRYCCDESPTPQRRPGPPAAPSGTSGLRVHSHTAWPVRSAPEWWPVVVFSVLMYAWSASWPVGPSRHPAAA